MRSKSKWAAPSGRVGRDAQTAVADLDAQVLEDRGFDEVAVEDSSLPAEAGGGIGSSRVRVGPGGANIVVRALRACSGAVTVGVLTLAAVVVVTAVLAGRRHFPGPGVESVAVHVAAAVAVLVAQHYADRRRGVVAAAAALAVPVVAGVVLWTQWWT